MQELRIFGPPGTGKTTRLATVEIPKAVEALGEDKVMIVSFTRAAAKEIASKPSRITGEAIPVAKKNVGTLHSICYRALNNPEIAEGQKKLWNDQHPSFSMSGGRVALEGGLDELTSNGADNGDKLLASVNLKRLRMLSGDIWTGEERNFYNKWKAFKKDNDLLDFCDLIETAEKEIPYAPGNPDVLFVDEAQDFSPLQFKLVRAWGMHMKYFVLVGDDDQAIFSFSGASPDAFLRPPVEDKYKRVLEQSFRVPRAIFERANLLIQKVPTREPKKYIPRDCEGSVRPCNANYKAPEDFFHRIIDAISNQKTAMILGSCSYMLDPIKYVLMEKGIPFHNPYRKRRKDWNPLLRSSDTITGTDIITSFLDKGEDGAFWTIPQFVKWAKFLTVNTTGLRRKQGKAGIKALEQAIDDEVDGLHSARNVMEQILEPDAVKPALDRNVDWLMENIQKARRKAMHYPVKIFKNSNNLQALKDTPRIILGTIHSVKGGEADNVFLFPDISFQARNEVENNRKKIYDLYRLFYVGMTRAKENLVVMSPANTRKHGAIGLYLLF